VPCQGSGEGGVAQPLPCEIRHVFARCIISQGEVNQLARLGSWTLLALWLAKERACCVESIDNSVSQCSFLASDNALFCS